MMRRFGWLILVIAAASASWSTSSASTSSAQVRKSIAVRLHAPPSVEADVTVALTTSGIDVTAELCERGWSDHPDPRPELSCPDVPDGVYELAVDSPDASVRSSVHCDDLATPTYPIRIGVFWDVNCSVVASTPALHIVVPDQGDLGPIPEVPAIQLVRDDTLEYVDDCETDVDEVWCTGLDEGVYTAVAAFPDGYSGEVQCGSSPTLRGFEHSGASLHVTDDAWLWSCEVLGPFPSLRVVVDSGANQPAPGWFDDLVFRVTGAGEDVSAHCQVVRNWKGPAPPPFIELHCLNLLDGRYNVNLEGLPSTVQIDTYCVDVYVRTDEPNECGFVIGGTSTPTSAPSSLPVGSPTVIPTVLAPPGPLEELPPTGTSTGLAIAAGLLMSAGAALCVAARRSRARRA